MYVFAPVLDPIMKSQDPVTDLDEKIGAQHIPALVTMMADRAIGNAAIEAFSGYVSYFNLLLTHPAAPASPAVQCIKWGAATWPGMVRATKLPSITDADWQTLMDLDAADQLGKKHRVRGWQYGEVGLLAPLLPTCPPRILIQSWEKTKQAVPSYTDVADLDEWEELIRSVPAEMQISEACLDTKMPTIERQYYGRHPVAQLPYDRPIGAMLSAPHMCAALLRQTDPAVLSHFADKVLDKARLPTSDLALAIHADLTDYADSVSRRHCALALAIALNDNCSPETFTKLRRFLKDQPTYAYTLALAADWTKDTELDMAQFTTSPGDALIRANRNPNNDPIKAMLAFTT
jgi:hypothetical protein